MADYTNAEGLIIEIESDASGAAGELDQLNKKLAELKDVVSNSKPLNTFAKNFDAVVTAMMKLQGINTANISALAGLSTALASLNGVSIKGTTIPKRIKEIAEAVSLIPESTAYKMVGVADALSKLSVLNGISISKTIPSRLEEIAVLADKIKAADFTKLKELVASLTPLAQLAVVDSQAMRDLSSSLNNFSKVSSTSAKRGKTFNTVLANMRVRTLAVYMGLAKVANIITDNLTTYGDYIETLNLFSVSMGEAGEQAYEYAVQVQDALGIDLTQWMKSQGVFQTLAKGFGIATDRATIMSQQLTQLAYDISSFYNISVADAIQKVQSAFSGELEPVRRLGYDLSQARLQAIALSLGIDENVSSMDQAEKASLRYYAMLTQVTDAQGDLARTLESPTNQIRIFQAQLNQLSRSLGQLFIPVLNKVLPYLNAIVRVLKWIIDEIAALFGYTLPGVDSGASGAIGDVTDGLGGMQDQIDGTNESAEKLKNTLASFDEINLIGSQSGGSGSGGAPGNLDVGNGFNFDLPTYDFLGEATENRAKAIAESIKKHIAPAVEAIKSAIMYIRENWDNILATTKVLIATIAAVKFASWLTGIGQTLKEINSTALGISLAVAGITIAFQGGQDIADGNYLRGFIEAGLGIALGTIGGAIAFGPAGAVIGFTVSLVGALIGFKLENDEKIRAEADAIFYAYDTTRVSMDEFVGSFRNFADSLTAGWEEVVQAYGQMSQAKLDFKDNLISMDALIQAFRDGKISAEEFAQGMETVFEGLGTALTGYLEGAQNVIKTELSGALGAYLTEAGWTLAEVQTMMDTAQGNYMKALETEENYIRSLEDAYSKGFISVEQYNEGLAQAQGKIQQITAAAARGEEGMVDFSTALSKGVNLDSLDVTIQGITELESIYTESLGKIEDRRAKLVEAMKAMRDDPLADDATKHRWQQMIDDTNEYFDKQKKSLTDGYADALDVIAAETTDAWIDVYESMGAEVALDRLNTDVTSIADALMSAYSTADINGIRQTTLADLIKFKGEINDALYLDDDNAFMQWVAEFQKWKGYIDNPQITHDLKIVFDKYVEGAKDATESTKALSHNIEEVRKDIKEKFDNVLNREGGVEQIQSFLAGMMEAYPQFAEDILDYKVLLEETLGIDLGDIGAETISTLADGMEEESERSLLPKIQLLPDKMGGNFASMIDPEFYSATMSTIITAIVGSLEDDTGIIEASSNIVNTISGILGDPEGKIESASAGISTEVYDGMNGKTSEITGLATDWVIDISNVFKNDKTTKSEAEGYVNDIKTSMDGKTNLFKSVGDTIRSTIITAANAVGANSFTAFGGNTITTIVKSISANMKLLETPSKAVIKSMTDNLNAGLTDIKKFPDSLFQSLASGMTSSASKNDLSKSVKSIDDLIYAELNNALPAMENIGYNVTITVAKGIANSGAKSELVNSVKGVRSTIENEFTNMSNNIEKTITDMLKKVGEQFKGFKITGAFNVAMASLNGATIPGFANGGYPNSADLFYANENGVPEYVGSIGGRTAVANNNDIVKGVSEGVYRAIKETGIAQDVKVLTKKQNTTVFAPSKEAGMVMAQSTSMYRGTGGRYQ